MIIKSYLLAAGRLQEQPAPADQSPALPGQAAAGWFDIQEASPAELQNFLRPLDLHPLQLKRCLDSVNDPAVVEFGKSLLMEYPAAFEREAIEPAYLTILLQDPVLVTIRHGNMPALDELVQELVAEAAEPVLHPPQIIYLILDQFADLNVEAQIQARDQILLLSDTIAGNPNAVKVSDLSTLRAQVEKLVSLVENQLYCVSALNASDNESLRDPHRKAYMQDLLSEIEIAQRGVYRLEARVKDLYNDFQAVGADRVERRLRLLTIVSAITLPLGLVAGLLGMNVGGLPGTTARTGFVVVIVLMILVALVEYWYFRRKGWFD